jgi:hypothetical protein
MVPGTEPINAPLGMFHFWPIGHVLKLNGKNRGKTLHLELGKTNHQLVLCLPNPINDQCYPTLSI